MCHHWLAGDWLVDVVWSGCYFDRKGNRRFESVGVECAWQVDSEACRVVYVNVCKAARVNGNIDDEFPSYCERYVVVEAVSFWDVGLCDKPKTLFW